MTETPVATPMTTPITNLSTEAEARNRWCPMMSNRKGEGHQPVYAMCVASHCMAWRWRGVRQGVDTGVRPRDTVHTGYCGLAGSPP